MALTTDYPSTPQPTGASGGEPQDIPYHVSPPWGEAPIYDELEPHPVPAMESDPKRDDEYLHNAANLAFGTVALDLDWQNDDQYGWPPPGAPNRQDFQSGHTSIVVHNQSAEQGWGTDPAFAWPRYPHMENKFPGYNRWGIFRRNGEWPAQKLTDPVYIRMQQHRDRQSRHALAHRQHGVIVADAATVPYTMNVTAVDPTTGWAAEIGPEGVTP